MKKKRFGVGQEIIADSAPLRPRKTRGQRKTGGCEQTSDQEHALAVQLPVEQPVGLVGLIEAPLLRDQSVDIDLAVDTELGAFGLNVCHAAAAQCDRARHHRHTLMYPTCPTA